MKELRVGRAAGCWRRAELCVLHPPGCCVARVGAGQPELLGTSSPGLGAELCFRLLPTRPVVYGKLVVDEN